MTCLLCRNRVVDYAGWKAVFDAHGAAHREAGLRLVDLWRSVEDPNNVFFRIEVADVDKARAFLESPESAAAGKTAGVIDGEFHFVEEAPIR